MDTKPAEKNSETDIIRWPAGGATRKELYGALTAVVAVFSWICKHLVGS